MPKRHLRDFKPRCIDALPVVCHGLGLGADNGRPNLLSRRLPSNQPWLWLCVLFDRKPMAEVDAENSFDACLRREVKKEIGFDVAAERDVGSVTRNFPDLWITVLAFGIVTVDEHSEYRRADEGAFGLWYRGTSKGSRDSRRVSSDWIRTRPIRIGVPDDPTNAP